MAPGEWEFYCRKRPQIGRGSNGPGRKRLSPVEKRRWLFRGHYQFMLPVVLAVLADFAVAQLCMSSLCGTCTNPATPSEVCLTCTPFTNAAAPSCGACITSFSPTSSNTCVFCHSSCNVCSGPNPADCISCINGFTIGTGCSPPGQTATPASFVLDEQYSGYGFGLANGWTAPGTSNCGGYYIVGGWNILSTSAVTVTYTALNNLYRVRLIINVFMLNINAWSSGDSITVSYNTVAVGSLAPPSYTTGASNICGDGNADMMFKYDLNGTTSGTTLALSLQSTGSGYWGFSNVYIIASYCHSECATCSGYLISNCNSCTNTNKAVYSGTCLCTGSYYLSGGVCVSRCPSSPSSTYGDSTTRNCVANCPATYYAQDLNNLCVSDCNSGLTPPLFKDTVALRCVQTCPPGYFKLTANYTCVATCPSGTYANSVDNTCSSSCPLNSTYSLYKHNNLCVSVCPSTFFASDVSPSSCLSSCSNPYYQDTTLGYPRCIQVCPAPNYFGQNTTSGGRACVATCLTGYGDVRPVANGGARQCLATCPTDTTASAPTFGLLSNKICYYVCPNGTWGNTVSSMCETVPTSCQTGYYANNYTNLCVLPSGCPVGSFADPNSRYCVFKCPNITTVKWFGDTGTRTCTTSCSTGFGDGGINLCVATCFTLGTFADPNTGNTCVTNCAQPSGQVWYADDYSRTCLQSCPYPGQGGACSGCPTYFGDPNTFTCVTQCPSGWFASSSTVNYVCVQNCPTNYFQDTSTGTGLCVNVCPIVPALFGNALTNICVAVCPLANSLFGDPTVVSGSPTTSRRCVTTCPANLYRDSTTSSRYCVATCNSTAWANTVDCVTDPTQCGANKFADSSTSKCVSTCPAAASSFGDRTTSLCVLLCPSTYYADVNTNRECVQTCASPNFGNNNTRTCEPVCLDYLAYADAQDANRRCVALCSNSPILQYANSFTKTCVTSTNCPTDYYGENTTRLCVNNCPSPSFGDPVTRYCVAQCQGSYYGDSSTGYRICKTNCPDVPSLFMDPTNKLCMATCTAPNYGDPNTLRSCIALCRSGWFSYDPTRLCLTNCPSTYFGDSTASIRKCWPSSMSCPSNQYGDSSTNLCVFPCPSNPSFFAQNTTKSCVSMCPTNQYANPWDSNRYCVALCPAGATDSYGDNVTNSCVKRCVQASTWADPQLRMCVAVCSSAPTPSYSENVNYRCVTSLNCPSTPQLTYGQNHTRTCIASCWMYPAWDNTVIQFADNTSRMCVNRCPATTYGTTFTGAPICVSICPVVPRQFGDPSTNLCVATCPISQLTFGDPTGSRLCVTTCPNPSPMYYAQLNGRICVTVCQSGTWGRTTDQTCVTTPAQCQSTLTQWAQSYTNMCVTTCPQLYLQFADPTTFNCVRRCVATGAATYYADLSTRMCVFSCPSAIYGRDGTFGDNTTGMCVTQCVGPNTFGDPYNNRSCAATCSQSTATQFADPSTKLCVAVCPSFPLLYGNQVTKVCVAMASCPSGTFANDVTRLCSATCPDFYWQAGPLCVSRCPQGTFAYSSALNAGGDNKCYSTCPASTYAQTTDNTCKSSCLPRFSQGSSCVDKCSPGTFALTNGSCVASCNPTFGNVLTTACTTSCPAGTFRDTTNFLCVQMCPAGTFSDTGATPNACVATCSGSLNAEPISRQCVATCNAGYYKQSGVCVATCTSGYADDSTRTCESTCVLATTFGQSSTKKCVTVCPSGKYRDPNARTCVSSCTASWYADPSTMFCVATCPTAPKLYGYTTNYTCMNPCIGGTFSSGTLCYLPANCPGSTYADSATVSCVSQCPGSTFANTATKVCVSTCPANTFADPATKVCQATCTVSGYFADPSTWRCVLVCPLSAGTYGNPSTLLCVTPCPAGTFGENATRTCVATCPAYTNSFGYLNSGTSTRLCLAACPGGFFMNPSNRQCLSGCIVTSPQLYADSLTNTCLPACPNGYFADPSSRTCMSSCATSVTYPNADPSTGMCVTNCPDTPLLYAENNVCVPACLVAANYAQDLAANTCTANCAAGTFANPLSKRCDTACPNGYFADSTLNICDTVCATLFADNTTRACIATCDNTKNLFGDPLLKACVLVCSGNQFADPTNQQCVTQCTTAGYFADSLTKTCTQTCPAFNRTYGLLSSRTCVNACPNTWYSQESTRQCTQSCLAGTFADSSTLKCVSTCPIPNMYGDPNGNVCVSTVSCTTGFFSDPSTRTCVATCASVPPLFGLLSSKSCVQKCPVNLYADNFTRRCVATCPAIGGGNTLDTYGDPWSSLCVTLCPQSQNYFANDQGNRLCVPVCPSTPDYYGDPLTRKCITNCPADYYADTQNPSRLCVKQCMAGSYRVNSTQRCVVTCPAGQFSIDPARICLDVCPSSPSLFGDSTTKACVSRCTSGSNLFGDPLSRGCVATCPNNGSIVMYADSYSGTCVPICPVSQSFYGDNTNPANPICVSVCPANYYKDNKTRTCVSACPAFPQTYRIVLGASGGVCLYNCPSGYYGDSTFTCITACDSSHWSDPSTNLCVIRCPTKPFTFGDSLDTNRRCMATCSGGNFADNLTQTCVGTCPAADNTWGSPTYTCVKVCPSGYFANLLASRLCVVVSACPASTFADELSVSCVANCPNYTFADSVSRRCLRVCPTGSFMYRPTWTCIYPAAPLSNCPSTYFADPSTQYCLQLCSSGFFALSTTGYCVATCPSGTFASNFTRTCASGCSSLPLQYADSTTFRCVNSCPATYFGQNSSLSCVSSCSASSSFADPGTLRCQPVCTLENYYADSSTWQCVTNCPSIPNSLFASKDTKECVTNCPSGQYADTYTRSCVLICPSTQNTYGQITTGQTYGTCVIYCNSGFFSDASSQQCVTNCPSSPSLFADTSSGHGVCRAACPTAANTYADQVSRSCVASCPSPYFAQPNTRTCVTNCPANYGLFADTTARACIQVCSRTPNTFADSLTMSCVATCPIIPVRFYARSSDYLCVQNCGTGLFGDNATKSCVAIGQCTQTAIKTYSDATTHMCLLTCSLNFFADNSTWSCVSNCPTPTFSDPLTRTCVSACQRPAYFQDPTTNRCVTDCPSGSFADTVTQSCIAACNQITDQFAFQSTNQCVDQCPPPFWGDPNSKICVSNCPQYYFPSPVTRKCQVCPVECNSCTGLYSCTSCINGYRLYNGACTNVCVVNSTVATYTYPFSMTCVTANNCPTGYYANNQTVSCSATCPTKQFGNAATGACTNCPATCSVCSSLLLCSVCVSTAVLGQDSMCYAYCGSPPLLYFSGTSCVSTCLDGTYLNSNKVNCVSCSSTCRTCTLSANNCLSCAASFMYNSTCVSTCPTGFYGDADLVCRTCTGSSAPACDKPLTFQTTTGQENYKYFVILNFSQPIDFSDPDAVNSLFDVSMGLGRVLQTSVATVVNKGLSYTVVKLSDNSYKLVLNTPTDLKNPQFKVSVNNPAAIKGANGATLQQTSSSFTFKSIVSYNMTAAANAPTNVGAYVLSGIEVGVFFIMAWVSPRSFFLALFAFQTLNLVNYGSAFAPPDIYFFLRNLQLSHMSFLPNMFAPGITSNCTLNNTYQRVRDLSVDNMFVRNAGYSVFLILVYLSAWLVFKLLSLQKLVKSRSVRQYCTNYLSVRFRFSFLYQLCVAIYYRVLFFAMVQFTDVSLNCPIVGFSLFLGTAFLLALLAFPVLLAVSIYQGNNPLAYLYKLKEPNWFQRYYPVQELVKRILIVFFLVAAYKNAVAQSVLIATVLLLSIVYWLLARGLQRRIGFLMNIFIQAGLLAYVVFQAAYNQLSTTINSSTRSTVANIVLGLVMTYLTIILIWQLFRAYIDLAYIWRNFKNTDFYMQYIESEEEKFRRWEAQRECTDADERAPVLEPLAHAKELDAKYEVDRVYQVIDQQGKTKIRLRKKKKVKRSEVRKKIGFVPVHLLEAIEQDQQSSLADKDEFRIEPKEVEDEYQPLELASSQMNFSPFVQEEPESSDGLHLRPLSQERSLSSRRRRKRNEESQVRDKDQGLPFHEAVDLNQEQSQVQAPKQQDAAKVQQAAEQYPLQFEQAQGGGLWQQGDWLNGDKQQAAPKVQSNPLWANLDFE